MINLGDIALFRGISESTQQSLSRATSDVSLPADACLFLNAQDIELCLGKLRGFVHAGHVLFATFSEGDSSENAKGSHSHAGFRYSRREMERFGRSTGWVATYIGDWSHPRGQKMMRYVAADPSLWSRLRRLLGNEGQPRRTTRRD